MTDLRLLALSVLFVAVIGCESGELEASDDSDGRAVKFVQPDASTQIGQLEIRVVDASTGASIAGASVLVATTPITTVRTGTDGIARIDSLRPRPVAVTIEAAGYESVENLFNVGQRGRQKAIARLTSTTRRTIDAKPRD